MGPNFPEALAIAPQAPSTGADDVAWAHDSADAVSYTHLTLPTSDLV